MKLWIYPIVALIFNVILFNSFHWGEYGTALAVVITVPLIVFVSLVLTFVHYRLNKKNLKTKYYQVGGFIVIVLISYFLFPTQKRPLSIIKEMSAIAKNYNNVTINDYFLKYRYENYEKIVAAKKKYYKQLADTAYSVNISNFYDYKQLYKTYGINFFNNDPAPTNDKLIVETLSKDTFKFTEYVMGDTISFSGNKYQMDAAKQKTDSFSELGAGHYKDTTLKEVEVNQMLKRLTPDEELFAYKVFYWLL